MKLRVIAMFLALYAPFTIAEPTSTIRWLMNEPASLFDLGMLRLREMNRVLWIPKLLPLLDEGNLKIDRVGLGGVVYSWEKNRINISVSTNGKIDENTCRALLREYKNIIANQYYSLKTDQKLRKKMVKSSESMLASTFDHVNHSSKSGPKRWREKVADIMTITVGIKEMIDVSNEASQLAKLFDSKSIFCTTPLKQDDITISKY